MGGKKWWQSKTIWLGLGSVLASIGTMAEAGTINVQGVILIVVGALGVVFRNSTSEPIAKKE